ncbi:hypothetical protein MTO96_010413 [Rhipicephalus appendiculatus]
MTHLAVAAALSALAAHLVSTSEPEVPANNDSANITCERRRPEDAVIRSSPISARRYSSTALVSASLFADKHEDDHLYHYPPNNFRLRVALRCQKFHYLFTRFHGYP